MRDVAIAGAGMTRFAKYPDRGLKELSREAVTAALDAAGMDKRDLEVAIVGNAAAGLTTGQECIRAQVVLREMGIDRIPMVNAENACASSSTAFQLAWLYVASVVYDVALALGVEKMYTADKSRALAAFSAGVDVEQLRGIMEQLKLPSQKAAGAESGAGKSRSLFMDIYAAGARAHMAKYGTTKEHYARIAAKNHNNGSLNPHAQYRERYTPEEILAAPPLPQPLTRLMCAAPGDGAAAAGPRPAGRALEMAGLGINDVDVMEVHDASAPAELGIYEELGLCGEGEGGRLVDEGATELGGRIPVNTSGGLLAKGHPVGATGVAQLYQIWLQLRGEAGERQVPGARVGLTENGGGMVRREAAATTGHIPIT